MRKKLHSKTREAPRRAVRTMAPSSSRRTAMSNEAELWNAVENRDASRDGTFVYGVMTTGVYCRPSCSSRRPLRKNVRFFATTEEAERAGLRACKRCRPTGAGGNVLNQVVHELARQLEAEPEQTISLEQLAKRAGYSPFHLQRSFKAIMGSSPKEYQTAARVRRLKTELRNESPVADAIYQAGFGSGSRVYEKADGHLGMTPSEYRSGGKGLTISYASGHTPLGLMMIGATDRGICFLQFGEADLELETALKQQFPAATLQPMPDTYKKQFDSWMTALNRHLRGLEPQLDLPLDVRGTAFQLIVWRYLQKLPYGEVRSYSEVATAIGRPSAARAVAQACATNSVALLIPCHRVVRGTGELGGYRWGMQRKRVLLDTERAASKR
jgi:AraC family transcriptional regulator, regulatory protein of adaptative response / methylated-DNA-[protein]-cysteine methyltransferase